MPVINVEFFGIPRERAGVSSINLEAKSVEELLSKLHQQLPRFAERCLSDGRLNPEYLMSINGKQFTRDETTQLSDGDSVLILSADVGG